VSRQRFRNSDGGRIDRSQHLRFSFDDRDFLGHPGDTLASALLANGVRLVGRSFKYHRPRGILTAGSAEPNALVQLRDGGRSEPNVRATVAELYDGLSARSQNRWPSLKTDVGAINRWFGDLLPAGFYYKTFMWPAAGWTYYESAIRRMAGLGRAPEAADPDRYEKQYAHCDVLVVGGGPAGLMAAHAAAETGARVVLADEQSEIGGSLLDRPCEIDDLTGWDWLARMADALTAAPNVRLLPRTTVTGYYDHNFLAMVERVADHKAAPDVGEPRQRLWRVRAQQVVLATGALERALAFADNDLPGVMLAGAAQTYANRFGVRAGRRAVVAGNNDTIYPVALDLAEAGIEVAAIVDARPEAPVHWLSRASDAGLDVLAGRVVARALGGRSVKGAAIAKLGQDGRSLAGSGGRYDCDLICMAGGWTPTLHLYSQGQGRLHWDAGQATFLPGEAAQAVRVAGAANGEAGLRTALTSGVEAGHAAAADAGFDGKAKPKVPRTPAPMEGLPLRPLWLVPKPAGRAGEGGRRFVDFQNDVTAVDIGLAAREGYQSIEHVKRYTTAGMGTDQGKTGGLTAMAVVAEARDADIPEIGHTTYRPPYTPVTFGALAGREVGPLFDPVRRTPMQSWHEDHGAVFEPVGQWWRPRAYPRAGETTEAAVAREARAARHAVGVLDASTLGKIDIQGPDAAEFLNRIYINHWDRLKVGTCRYGLMLHEDGMVFDDGVTARLGHEHFHMTTTSGNAAAVLAWLEDWHQTEWPDLQVYCSSVTEQWAVISLCGLFARELLRRLCDDVDLSPDAFPFMTWRDGTVAGIPARLFRVSFTGELSYEINVPAAQGLALWEAVMRTGETFDITPFGTDAMHLLRAEVGFIMVGQETDGTVTPVDLGLGSMVSQRKDFIGKRSLTRADTRRDDRLQLVGLLTDDPDVLLVEGAQLVAQADPPQPATSIGHVTSSYRSPNVGRSIALALLQAGRSRYDDIVHAAWDGQSVPVRVVAPKFFDPDGGRARG